MPRISVCIPSYNHENYIAGTIQSVLSQTYQDFEIVVVDDGSVDGTVAAIQTFDDPRLRLFSFPRNQGACKASNHAILQSTGEFIAILNSDDEFLPHKLETQVRFLDEHPEVGAVFGYPQIIDQDGSVIPDSPQREVFVRENRSRFEWLRYFFIVGNCLCHPTILIRRSCYEKIGLYDLRLAQLPDFDMWVRLCTSHEIHIIPENLINFRVHRNEENASGRNPTNLSRLTLEFFQVLNHYLDSKISSQFRYIFPDIIENLSDFRSNLVPFYLATIALQVELIPNKLFGLQTLFDVLKDDAIAEQLSQLYDFTYANFLDLTKQYDLFRAVEIGSIAYVPPRWKKATKNLQILEQLTAINLIVFPDWQQPEDCIQENLVEAMRVILAHPNIDQVTLLIYADGNVDIPDVSLMASAAFITVMMEDEELEVQQEPNVLVIGVMQQTEWAALLPKLTARIALPSENQVAIAANGLTGLLIYPTTTH